MNEQWIQPGLPPTPHVKALSTTRAGGVSKGSWSSLNLGLNAGDNPESVRRNRAILRRHLPADPVWLQQVHGTAVHKITSGEGRKAIEADAAVAAEAGQVCAVLTADCLPVLFCNRQGTEVAAAHAGWRGLCSGVLEQTVRAMQSPPEQLFAWLGPAIGPDAYEVGDEVRRAFVKYDRSAETAFRKRGDRWLLNLCLVARQRLSAAGVKHISGGEWCTFSDPERFFSYRRDGVTGRMATLIWLE